MNVLKKYLVLLSLLFLLILSACGSNSESTDSSSSNESNDENSNEGEETYVLTASSALLEGAAQSKGFVAWAEALEEKTNGRVRIEQFSWGGVTLDEVSTLEGLGNRVVDVAFISNAYHPTTTPLTNALQPMFLDDLSGAYEVENYLYETYPEIKEEWNAANVEPVAWFHGSSNLLMSNFEFDTLEELKNKKVRALGQALTDATKNMGSIPVNISAADVYSALEKGTIDAVGFPAYALESNKIAEVVTQVTDYGHGGSFMWFGIAFNKDLYDSFPDDIKQAIKEIAHIPAEVEKEAYFKDAMIGLKAADERGVRLITLPKEEQQKFLEAIQPETIWESAIQAAEDAGYENVREMMDEAVRVLQEFNENHEQVSLIDQYFELKESGELEDMINN